MHCDIFPTHAYVQAPFANGFSCLVTSLDLIGAILCCMATPSDKYLSNPQAPEIHKLPGSLHWKSAHGSLDADQ